MSDIKRFINNWDYYYFWENIPVHISGISLNKSTISLAVVWQTYQLTATITPTWYVDSGAINWSSSDTSIATVSNTWLVTCVTPWTCTITATTVVGGFSASCNIISSIVFDFQNDWALSWTWQTVYWTPTFTSGQWWTLWTDDSDMQSSIMPPNSVYDGRKLLKWKLRIYKWVQTTYSGGRTRTVWAWATASALNPCVMWEQPRWANSTSYANVYDGSDHSTVTSWKTWELVLEYMFNDDGSLVLSVDGTTYNLWQYASLFRTQWDNKNLWINIWRWWVAANGNIYIRKLEITTTEK